ncbi:MAG: hypothetical protein ETSY1_00010, partial [Candidatus Entotheonella factor]
DDQVKIRGFRVELGEIETVLSQHPAVQEAVVVAREGAGQLKQLVAYVISSGEGLSLATGLRAHLKQILPDYMMPSAFVELDNLPLTPSGKVDRRALPAPEVVGFEDTYVPPRTPTEEVLAAIWSDVLGADHLGMHDSFFDLGGHSLLATQVISRIRDAFRTELPVRVVFESPTIAELAMAVDVASQAESAILVPPPIRAVARVGDAPLSYAQQRLWFLDQLEDTSPAYNLPMALRLTGSLDAAALQYALNHMIQCHDVLRTTFPVVADQPVQRVDPNGSCTLDVVDLHHLAAPEQAAELHRRLAQQADCPFDLACGPLLRVTLYVLGDCDQVLLVNMHHIISDAWSLGIWWRELDALYSTQVAGQSSLLSERPLQYADFAQWQRQWLSGEVLATQLAYWEQQLADVPARLELPTDHPRPRVQTFKGQTEWFDVVPPVAEALTALSRRSGVSLFMTLYAAFVVLLYRYSGQDDIVIGTPIANRHYREIESTLGFFVNTLALRTDVSGQPSFDTLLKRVRQVMLSGYAHQDIPFEQILSELDVERTLSHAPLFQVMFALDNAPAAPFAFGDLEVTPVAVDNVTAKFDLTLYLSENSQAGSSRSKAGLKGGIEYNTDLFECETIQRMISHFQQLLAGLVADPNQPIDTLPLLSEAERQQVLLAWNNTRTTYPHDLCIHQLFEHRVEQQPDAIALVFDETCLTYSQLNRRANQLAHYLQELGVGPEVMVGLCLERSPEMVVGVLGILKAGGAYLPLDPAYPRERLTFMLADTNAPVILTQQQVRHQVADTEAEIICLDTAWEQWSGKSTATPVTHLTAQHLAYVMYTSGSTGRPKGIGITHQSVVRLVKETNYIDLGPTDIMALASNSAFDAATFELWGALLNGARLAGLSREVALSPRALQQAIRTQGITTLFLTTALFNQIAQEEPEAFRAMPNLLFGGEAVEVRRVQEVLQHGSPARLLHVYGPTENTTFTTWHRVQAVPDEAVTVPIGRPLANTQIYILDRQLQPVPIGIPGELCMGGDGLARAYYNRPALTAAQFIPNPFGAGCLYKSGDLARYLPDGSIEFLGRIDTQVKLRGFRIEPGEIEVALSQHEAVQEALVLVREHPPGHKQLASYIVSGEPDTTTLIPALTAHLKQSLPDYMIPSAFVVLDRFPLNPNGKVDRQALPAPETSGLEGTYVAPRTPTEEVLVAIWSDVLGVDHLGIHDNFFDLGGHSLLAIRIISRLQEVLQVTLSVRMVFEAPTIDQLAAAIETARYAESSLPVPPPLRPMGRQEPLPLSYAQQRLWFLNRLEGPSSTYNVPIAFRLSGQLHVTALEQALNAMVRRHEILRTIFPMVEGEPIQHILPTLSLPLPSIGLQHLSGLEQAAELHHRLSQEAARPFDLSQGPLLRMTLFELDDHESVLLVNMHHIIADDWSMEIWWHELDILYRACTQPQDTASVSPLPPLIVQYADFAQWQREWLTGEVLERQLAYWQDQLEAAPTLLPLPTDRPRPREQTFNGRIERFELDAQLAEAVRDFGRQAGASPFMVFLAAFAALLSRYSGQEDLVIGTPVANRPTREMETVIGLSTNTLALRLDLTGDPGFDMLLKHVQRVTLDAFLHQDIPFEQLVSELNIERNLSHSPLFQVVLVWQNLRPEPVGLGDLHLSPVDVDIVTARFDLVLYLTEIESDDDLNLKPRLGVAIEYNTDLFERSTITRMVGHFEQLLDGIMADPAQPIHTLPLLTQAERHQLLDTRNATQTTYPRAQCAHQLIEAQAQLRPMAQAVVHPPPGPNASLTYGALNQRANQLAHYLRKLGVGPEVIVAVYLERSLDMVISLLAVLKAGGTYTPIDPGYPPERVKFILADTQTPVLLTQTNLAEPLVDAQVEAICLDRDWPAVARESTVNPVNEVTSDHLAYLIYTSGSTGRPKGVQVTHGSLLNLIFWLHRLYDLTDADRVPQCSGLSFDVSVYDIWPCLTAGATLCLPLPEVLYDPLELQDWLLTNRITKGFIVTALAERLLSLEWPSDTPLQRVMAGGEKLRRVPAPHHPFKYYNGYGPAENTVITTCGLIPPNEKTDTIPLLGRPIDNVQVYILDRQWQPVPTGVYGDLCIGGDSLSRGYLRRPGLTAERFLPNPFSPTPGARMYTTGDLVRYLPNSEIEFVGRMDHQIKIRGFRIELGEIESVLAGHAQVQAATVLAWDMESDQSDKRLVAYLVLDPEQPPTAEALRDYLKAQLPEYMVPAVFVPLEALPLTPNGKVDRRALPAPDQAQATLNEDYVSPQSDLEKALAAIWQEVLSLDQVGIHDNFFAVGGHSLSIINVHAKLADLTTRDVSITDLFRYPTIASLAQYLGQSQPEPASAQPYTERAQSRREAHQRQVARPPRRRPRSRS